MIEVAGRRLALGHWPGSSIVSVARGGTDGHGVADVGGVRNSNPAWPSQALGARACESGRCRFPSRPIPTSISWTFLQNGEYLVDGRLVYSSPANTLPAGERGRRIEAVLWAMDQANVSHAVITGMPFLKKWAVGDPSRPTYYLDSSSRVVRARDTDYVLALAIEDYRRVHGAAAQLERLFPFVSGFDGTDLGAVDMIVKRIKEFPGVFKGIGEVMSRHDDLTNLTTGEASSRGSPGTVPHLRLRWPSRSTREHSPQRCPHLPARRGEGHRLSSGAAACVQRVLQHDLHLVPCRHQPSHSRRFSSSSSGVGTRDSQKPRLH